MQLFDEIPMLWGSLVLVYSQLTTVYDSLEKNRWANYLTIFSLFAFGFISTTIYLHFKIPILFQASYGFLGAIMLYYDISISKTKPCDVRLFYLSVLFYYTGFILWNIDNLFCDKLEQFRQQIAPQILVPFTQFHALWHCLAGYGSYLHIIYCLHSRSLIQNKNIYLEFEWTGIKLKNNLQHKKLA